MWNDPWRVERALDRPESEARDQFVEALDVDHDRYERDGFGKISGFCGAAEVEQLRLAVDRVLAAPRAALPVDRPYALAVLDRAWSPAVVALIDKGRLFAEHLLSGAVEPTFVLMHGVTATVEQGRGWHQALAFTRLPYSPRGTSIPLDEIEIVVLLDDALDDDMCPWFAPGYHVAPMLEHRHTHEVSSAFELIDPSRQLVLAETVALPMRAGDAIAYTLGTPHSCVLAKVAAPGSRVREVNFMRVGFRVASVQDPEDRQARLT